MEASSLAHKYANLKSMWHGMWQYKRIALASSFFVTVIGLAAVASMPNKYESSATVMADTRSILKPLLNGIAVQNDTDDGIQAVAMTLLSRDNLEKIALRADLDLKNSSDPEKYEQMLKKLKSDIQIGGSKKNNIYTITYQHENPITAEKVVSLTLKQFLETVMSQSRLDTNSATGFLETQIAERKKILEVAENKLAEFKRENQDKLPQQGSGYYASISSLKKEIDVVNGDILAKTAEVQTLKDTFIPKNTDGGVAVVSTPVDQRLAQLKQTMDAAALQYTEQHPDMIELKNQIDALERQRSEQEKEILTHASSGALTNGGGNEKSDILQKFALDVSQRESELGVLKVRKKLLEDQLDALNKKIQEVPQIEAALTSLQRDYNVSKDMYDKLVGRLEQAKISQNASQDTSDVKFQTLEPPRVPKTPAGPKRLVFYVAVFVVAVIVGLILAFLKNQLNPKIMDVNQLQNRASRVIYETDGQEPSDMPASSIQKIKILGSLIHLEHEKVRKVEHKKNILFAIGYAVLLALTLTCLVADLYVGDAPLKKVAHHIMKIH